MEVIRTPDPDPFVDKWHPAIGHVKKDDNHKKECEVCHRYLKTSDLRVEHVSQRMTFLYSPRLGNRSSWLVTKPTALISKVWRPGGTPNLDRMIAPTTDAGGYSSVSTHMRSEPPEMTLYKEAHWPQSGSQSLAVSQP